MRQFLLTSVFFIFILCIIGEVAIRTFRLVPDIPERFIDKYNIQRYKPGQSGFYTKAKVKWNVNKFGWLGTSNTYKDTIISIIGDSYIENIMNPIECNQGSILKTLLPNFSFFEAGRSGVTFIEAMEISKVLDIEVHPNYQLLYLNTGDFPESISEIKHFPDRLQVSIETKKLMKPKLKSPRMKFFLYNVKLLYYLYLKYPILVDNQNKGEVNQVARVSKNSNDILYNKLFAYCSTNYRLNNLVFVFHPNIDDEIVALANRYGIKTIQLDSHGDKTWRLGSHDGHWSCYGHNQVSKQVVNSLKEIVL